MKLSSTVSQNVRIFAAAAVIAVGAMGCGGSNDSTGGAGAGGTAGTGGGGSGAGGAGGGSSACTLDQVNKIIQYTSTSAGTNVGCTVPGSCHDAAGSAAGLDLASVGWQTKLVGKSPSATGGVAPYKSLCANMGFVYLKAGSNPASGLLIDKINPATSNAPCGVHMPNLGAALSPTDFACIQSYLTTLTK